MNTTRIFFCHESLGDEKKFVVKKQLSDEQKAFSCFSLETSLPTRFFQPHDLG